MEKATPCRQCRFKERMRLLDEADERRRQNTRAGQTGGRSPPRRPTPGDESPPPSPPPPPRPRPRDSPSPKVPPESPPAPQSPERDIASPYSSDFNSSVDNQPPPSLPKPIPKPIAGGSGDNLDRPGSPSHDPRSSPKPNKRISPNHDDDDDSGSKPSGGQQKAKGAPTIERPSSSQGHDDDRTMGKKLPTPVATPPVQPLNDVPSDDDISSPKPQNQAMLNQTSSSDSTTAQVQHPQWNTTMPQPKRSTPSPEMRNLGRRTSLDRPIASPPVRLPSPIVSRNQNSMPSPIPRARETPTNEIESPKSPVRNIASEVESDDETIEEELQNLRTTTDDDQDTPASDTADGKH